MARCGQSRRVLLAGLLLISVRLEAQNGNSISSLSPSLATDNVAFYRGFLPEVKVVGGGGQTGAPGSRLSTPVAVTVGGGIQNAPVTFTVISGGALLTASAIGNEKPSPTVQAQATVSLPNSPGNFAAQVYVHLPKDGTDDSMVMASIRSGDKTVAAQVAVQVAEPGLPPPRDFKLGANTATTIDVSWTPGDPTKPTLVEATRDGGANWEEVATFPPGVSAGRVYHLHHDSTYSFRLRTSAGDKTKAVPAKGTSGAFHVEVHSDTNPDDSSTLTWTCEPPTATGFRISRSDDNKETWKPLAEVGGKIRQYKVAPRQQGLMGYSVFRVEGLTGEQTLSMPTAASTPVR